MSGTLGRASICCIQMPGIKMPNLLEMETFPPLRDGDISRQSWWVLTSGLQAQTLPPGCLSLAATVCPHSSGLFPQFSILSPPLSAFHSGAPLSSDSFPASSFPGTFLVVPVCLICILPVYCWGSHSTEFNSPPHPSHLYPESQNGNLLGKRIFANVIYLKGDCSSGS